MSRWLVDWPARTAPMAALLCCPGAGAGASAFRGWAGRLPPFAAISAVQLPGREGRIDEPHAADLAVVADAVAEAWLARPALPTVVFGHSMGAALGFEVARRLTRAGRPVTGVVLSAAAPTSGGGALVREAELDALLIAYDPQNARITGNRELYDALAPVLAADITMLRGHRIEGAALAAPGIVLAGEEDRLVSANAAAGWSRHFAAPVDIRTMPGGHFFVFREARAEVLDLLASLLQRAVA